MNDEDDLVFLGLIAMMDPPREESKAAVEECISAGIKPIMITGDHKVTAAAIAKRIGILKDESEACEGAVIENMTDEELQNFVEGISVYARVSPEHIQEHKECHPVPALRQLCGNPGGTVRVPGKPARAVCAGTPAVYQPADRQPSGYCAGAGASHQRCHEGKTASYE